MATPWSRAPNRIGSAAGAAATAVGRPARLAEDVAEPVTPALRRPHVVRQVDELVEGDARRAEGADVLRQPVLRPYRLALEGAEHPVPDDQDAAVVAVEVDVVGAVVHAVVRGRVEDVLDRRRQPPNPLGVDPELVD